MVCGDINLICRPSALVTFSPLIFAARGGNHAGRVGWSCVHHVGHVGFLRTLRFPPTQRPHELIQWSTVLNCISIDNLFRYWCSNM